MAASDLTFNISALDKASKTFIRMAEKVDKLNDQIDELDRKRAEAEVNVDVDKPITDLRRLSSNVDGFASSSSSIMSGALKIVSANVILMGAVVAAGLAALPAVAALAATGIVLAFGGVLAAIGLIAAAQSEKVQNEFTELKDHVVSTVKEIAAPFESTLLTIADVARETFDAFVPALEGAFRVMAPAVSRFVSFVGEAFEELVPAVQPLTDAFAAVLNELGPKLPGLFSSISDALIVLAGVVEDNAEEFSTFIVLILGGIPLAIKAVAGLASVFGRISRSLRRSANQSGGILNELGKTFRTFTAAVRKIWRKWGDELGAITRFIWRGISRQIKTFLKILRGVINVVTGLITGDWRQVWRGIKQIFRAVWDFIRSLVRERIDAVRDIIRRGWDAVKSFTRGAWNRVRDIVAGVAGRVRDVVAGAWGRVRDITSRIWGAIRGAVSRAWNAIRSTISGAVNRVKGILSGLANSGPIRAAKSAFNGIKDVINTVRDAVNSLIDAIRSIPTPDLPDLPDIGNPFGNPFNNAAGGRVRGGKIIMVGERGPELFVPGSNGTIIPNDQLPTTGSGITIEHLEVKALGPRFDLRQVMDSLAWQAAS